MNGIANCQSPIANFESRVELNKLAIGNRQLAIKERE